MKNVAEIVKHVLFAFADPRLRLGYLTSGIMEVCAFCLAHYGGSLNMDFLAFTAAACGLGILIVTISLHWRRHIHNHRWK
jgi:hypothetical protein